MMMKNQRTRFMLMHFTLTKHEVTVGEYKRFIRTTGHRAPDWSKVAEDSPTDQHPIIYVSWFDAMAYTQWVGQAPSNRS